MDEKNIQQSLVPIRVNITNNRTNTPVLEPNNAADINNIITEMKAVLYELHNKTDKVSVKTKQILQSAISIVDHNGNIANNNTIKYNHPKIQDQINHVKSSTFVKAFVKSIQVRF